MKKRNVPLPALSWRGKSASYPSEPGILHGLETHGGAFAASLLPNCLIRGDNRLALSSLLQEDMRQRIDAAGGVKLIYCDPPFAVGADFSMALGPAPACGGRRLQALAYRDVWVDGLNSFLSMMHERLLLMRELLAEDGSLYLHCDWRSAPHMRLLLDEVFGPERFLGDIVWHYTGGGRSKRWFSRKHDRILHYAASKNWFFNPDAVRTPYKPGSGYAKGGIVSAAGKRYLPHPDGTPADDVWDIPMVNPLAAERNGYPTQKPEQLLERILLASSRPGDLVADFFCGSGGFPVVAQRLGRRWIAVDNAPLAVHVARKRLLGLSCPAAFSVLACSRERPPEPAGKAKAAAFHHVARFSDGECGYAITDIRVNCHWEEEGLICRLDAFQVRADRRAPSSGKTASFEYQLRSLDWLDWLDYWSVGILRGPDFAITGGPPGVLHNLVLWRGVRMKTHAPPLQTPALFPPEPAEAGRSPGLVLTLVDIFANECRCLLPLPQRRQERGN